jgi:hypothetical protein
VREKMESKNEIVIGVIEKRVRRECWLQGKSFNLSHQIYMLRNLIHWLDRGSSSDDGFIREIEKRVKGYQ